MFKETSAPAGVFLCFCRGTRAKLRLGERPSWLASHPTLMRNALYRACLLAQSLLYLAGGVNHLWHPKLYVAIMPPHYSHPTAWVDFTGIAEIAGGVGLLLPSTRRPAAWGLILMLIGYFDVHFYMLRHADTFAPIPGWALRARIPLQFLLIAWAYVYTRREGGAQGEHHSMESGRLKTSAIL